MNVSRNITFDVNNGQQLVFEQDKHDGSVQVYRVRKENGQYEHDEIKIIPNGQFVMLNNLYWHIMRNDIQNDFINPYGKNIE